MPILTLEAESCLVEVARRECNSECSPDPVNIEKSLQPSRGSVANNDIALNIDNQPCARHYNKTKDRYGGQSRVHLQGVIIVEHRVMLCYPLSCVYPLEVFSRV
jgi:hypothetical protein